MTDYNAPFHNQPQAVLDMQATKTGRMFLVGNGASLVDDLELLPALNGEATWTCNFFPSWSDRPFEPTYYALSENYHVNRHGIGKFGWLGFEAQRFAFHRGIVRQEPYQWVAKAPAEITVFDVGIAGLGDHLPPIPPPFCTMFYCLQLGLWMGYEEVYLLGNEFTTTGYAWDAQAERKFDEGLGRRIENVARLIRIHMERAGRKLFDCTPGGRLGSKGILEFRPLEEVLCA